MEVSVEQVGTLTIIGTSYEFRPLPNKAASDVEKPIQFLFDSPKGEVQIEYWEGVQATDSVEKLGSLAFVAWCTFKSGSTYLAKFPIRVGDSPTTLSIIYPFDAIYFWDIGKNLE
ncbi:hypothetical protein TFLX_04808 [Thermoflexales bacterium]|nr:hypothetical protein TFLX_04808 [Thermoflexales bacterium]